MMTGGLDDWLSALCSPFSCSWVLTADTEILRDNDNYEVTADHVTPGRKLKKLHRLTYRWNKMVRKFEKLGVQYVTNSTCCTPS